MNEDRVTARSASESALSAELAPTGAIPELDSASPRVEGPEPLEQNTREIWISLFPRDNAVETHPELFQDAIDQLQKFLNARPDAKEEISSLLEKRFGAPIDKGTWFTVYEGLSNYFGAHGAYLLNWLAYANTSERLAQLEPAAAPEVMAFLRSVLAHFGPELDASQLRVLAPSLHDWTYIDKHVYVDRLNGAYMFAIKLTKLNGEVLVLETSPDSAMNLARHLISMIVIAEHPEVFSDENREAFMNGVFEVISVLMPELQSESEADAEDDLLESP